MREKSIQGLWDSDSLMKRQPAVQVHYVRKTALMKATTMTGMMMKQRTGGVIPASIREKK